VEIGEGEKRVAEERRGEASGYWQVGCGLARGKSVKVEIFNMTDPLNSKDYFHVQSFTRVKDVDSDAVTFEVVLRTFPGLNYRLQSSS